jgi:hypothetical protein
VKTAVRIEAELVSPMVIVRERQERVYGCLDHIPGTTLRGALLSALWREGREPEIGAIVHHQRNRFPFLRPGPVGTTPAMLTTMSCKRAKVGHGLRDTLLARCGAAAVNVWRCAVCDQDLKRQEGYLHSGALVPPVLRTQRMHVGIDRQRGTAAPHVLFGATAVEPLRRDAEGRLEPLRMSGVGWFDAQDLPTLRRLAKEPIFVGKQRSRGYGELQLSFEDIFDDARVDEIAAGSEALAARLGLATGSCFTLGIVSPLIAYDPWLRASAQWRHWGIGNLELEEVYDFVETVIVDGWDFAAGIARDAEEAVAPGSVLFGKSRLPAHTLAERLAVLERCGVGERLDEGFGEVRANDAIHREQV